MAPPILGDVNGRVHYWASQRLDFDIQGFNTNTRTEVGPCAVNCVNWLEVYSFHNGGAKVVFGDGSVRFLRASITIRSLIALVTRANCLVAGSMGNR